jgi:hypothetical protein
VKRVRKHKAFNFFRHCRASIRVTTRDNQDDKFLMG